jgi:transcriptional regulator with XRE-family HTH domain
MLEIGKQIKEAREKKGVSQQEASRDTNISIAYIQAMEEGSTTFLPIVYIKNFYKMYAKYLQIEIDEKAIIKPKAQELLTDLEKETKEKSLKSKKHSSNKIMGKLLSSLNDRYKFINRTTIINSFLFVTIIIVIIVVFYFTLFYDSADKKAITSQEILQVTSEREAKPDSSEMALFEDARVIRLEARAQDSVWIKINIDDRRSEEVIMFANTARIWAAEEYFILSLSRAGAVEFWRNGELLPPLAGHYSRINELKITKDSIIKKAYLSDSARAAVRQANQKKQQQDAAPTFLTPSNIQRTSPFQDKKQDSLK